MALTKDVLAEHPTKDGEEDEVEDDYMSMAISEPKKPQEKETYTQRRMRMQREVGTSHLPISYPANVNLLHRQKVSNQNQKPSSKQKRQQHEKKPLQQLSPQLQRASRCFPNSDFNLENLWV